MSATISAAELRAMGIELPESIPDVAIIARSAMRIETNGVLFDPATQVLTMRLTATFDAPFRWVEIDATIEGDA